MIQVNVKSETVYLQDIQESHFPIIEKWYAQVEAFQFATGNKDLKTLKHLFLCSEPEDFFLIGIYTHQSNQMIGMISGEIWKKGQEVLWIRSIIVDQNWQHKGFGTQAVRLLLGYVKKEYTICHSGISVVRDNYGGVKFWTGLGFEETRCVTKSLLKQGKEYDILIMEKRF